ncbi:MAG: alanine--tRNA ligase [Candidatus Levybacteria bacterium]|nr:alanine--tRNA ligase [Candidatus Levybacteria bacterium]
MTAAEIIQKYISFFEKRGHKRIHGTPLVLENDSTVLFTTAGMQPLIPYLLGKPHPLGKRLVSLQKCLRTDDIDEVGDKKHHTFFEMLGNWSLGDYWKKEAIEWSYEFLTSNEWLGIEKSKLAISVFAGDEDALFDKESYDIWRSLGIPESRIAKLEKKDNWWGPAGQTGPCGPDTEMFVWTGKGKAPKTFDPANSEWIEVWNDVFMEYNKTQDGKFEYLKQKNVDTGMGLERITAVMEGTDDDYQTGLFLPVIKKIEDISGKKYEKNPKDFRIISDHIKAIVFILADGVEFSNLNRGYVPRKLLRRLIVRMQFLEGKQKILLKEYLSKYTLNPLIEVVVNIYQEKYPEIIKNAKVIKEKILGEWDKLKKQMESAYPQVIKVINKSGQIVSGKDGFYLFEAHGVNPEVTEQVAIKYGKTFDWEDFKVEFKKHQELSRTASAGMFRGGLADHSEKTIMGHTATHLMHQAIRDLLGDKVHQSGSNITPERVRFDFNFDRKLTDEEIKKIEDIVNEKIKENLPVHFEIMPLEKAKKLGAIGLFDEKYSEQVKVYFIGDYSKEFCGGPHVDFTSKVKRFKIIKQENIGKGYRRLYALVG